MRPNLDPQAPMQPQGSWFSRNWKWLVPVGCLVPLLCCGGTFGVAMFTGATMLKGSPALAQALEKASRNAEVTAALGTPLTPGMSMNFSMKETNGASSAKFSVPLTGPKGSGNMQVDARGNGGVWTFQRLEVEAGGKIIDVLAGEKADEPPPPDEDDLPPDEQDGD